MTILVKNIKMPFYENLENSIDVILSNKGIKRINNLRIFKKSIDARKKSDIYFVYTVICDAEIFPKNDRDIEFFEEDAFPNDIKPSRVVKSPPVVVGFGPCGIFCALMLARYGYNPIVIERGDDIDTRKIKVKNFFENKNLDLDSNVQFGEGGAGTFSDGKLITRIKDSRCNFVINEFYKNGAPAEILYSAKPHIGTENLEKIVKNLRLEINSLGGSVLFNKKLTGIKKSDNGYEIEINKCEKLFTSAVFLATGHSADDVYSLLLDKNILIEPKDYSVGLRIEHLQSEVDFSLYGNAVNSKSANLLPKGEYSMSYRSGERGVYTFCMCPGGEVVPCTSIENSIVTNGMSGYLRDGKNANAALCVSVLRSDYGSTPKKALEYQRTLERAAFVAGGGNYNAPFQTVGDFLEGRRSTGFSKIVPTYSMGVAGSNFDNVLPQNISLLLKEGLRAFSNKMSFFKEINAPLTGIETRTSAPCRILRGENLSITGYDNLYPCGEGAGYAGGITSAALDGIRCAVKFMEEE